MSEPTVTFFITTARSGTQWTASTLNKVYSDLLLAEHEPLGYRYEPRKTLRDLGKLRALLDREEIARISIESIARSSAGPTPRWAFRPSRWRRSCARSSGPGCAWCSSPATR